MGCMASRNGSSNGSPSSSSSKDVEAVIPGTVTTFGAKYLVPHGKRVFLSFEKNALLLQDKSSSSFVITDVTNGQEHETTMFLVERNSKETVPLGGTLVVQVKDPMTQQVIFTASQGSVYDGEGRLLFGISSSSSSSGMTENLVNRQGKPIQLKYGIDDADFSSNGAIFLLPFVANNNKKTSQQHRPIARICSGTENVILQQLSLSSDYINHHVVMEVAPGVDMALIVAMVLTRCHRHHDS